MNGGGAVPAGARVRYAGHCWQVLCARGQWLCVSRAHGQYVQWCPAGCVVLLVRRPRRGT